MAMLRPGAQPDALHALQADGLPLPAVMGRTMLEVTSELVDGWPSARRAVRKFFRRHQWVFDALDGCPPIERLNFLRCFGVRKNPKYDNGLENGAAVSQPYVHDRWTHSQHVACHVIALSCKLGLDEPDILAAAVAACLHDVGHAAFSHDGDYLLVPLGRPAHEERGQAIVADNPGILRILATAGLAAGPVLQIMGERGPQGTLQSVCDTLSYVTLDSDVAGIPLPPGLAQRVIGGINGVDNDLLYVTPAGTDVLAELLEQRAVLSRDVYFPPHNKLYSMAIVKVLAYLHSRGLMPLDLLERGHDDDVRGLLGALMNDRRTSLPPWVKSATCLAFGIDLELRDWRLTVWPTAEQHARYRDGLLVAERRTEIVTAPWDYTTKTIGVVVQPSGTVARLRADPGVLLPRDRMYASFVYRNP